MQVVALSPPGRFPTVVLDPGGWWDRLADRGCSLSRLSLNARWWRTICDAAAMGAKLDLHGSAWTAAGALDVLCRPATYLSATAYFDALTAVTSHLARLNGAQRQLKFSLESGVRARVVNYDDSRSLAEHSRRPSMLRQLIERSLPDPIPPIDLLIVNATSPEDLLTAMVAVDLLRSRQPRLHACLADHGYENFTLTPHLDRLRGAGTLDSVFDTIVERKEDRDLVVPALARALAAGDRPRGFIRGDRLSPERPAPPVLENMPAPTPTFAAEPIFWTRLSGRRCYWSRCAFCIHNVKYDSPAVPALSEIPAAVDRLQALTAAGYRTFIFSDEALSPAFLDRLSSTILARRLAIRWVCRAKLELAFDRPLFERMHASGCREVLFGVESIVPRTLRRMDKYVQGLDARAVESTIRDLADAGIGVHLNLMAGFPGETPEELTQSVEFAIGVLRDVPHATYALNYFTAFPATPVTRQPKQYGIAMRRPAGDMPASLSYACVGSFAKNERRVARIYPCLQERMRGGLGWDRFGDSATLRAALAFYCLSGHSVILDAKTLKRTVRPSPAVAPIVRAAKRMKWWPLAASF